MSASFPLETLPGPLSDDERQAVKEQLRGLLEWHRDLRRWPPLRPPPQATPIVSLYARGSLLGCSGLDAGPRDERLTRAFLQTLGDRRFGGIGPDLREELVLQVSYLHSVEPCSRARIAEQVEVGTHGLALVPEGATPSLLLPDVACDHHWGPAEFLKALEHKSGMKESAWPDRGLFTFETERVSARLGSESRFASGTMEAAASWLGARVDDAGNVDFGFDPRTGSADGEPVFYDGRVAILIRALFTQPAQRGAAVRARRRLEQRLNLALSGTPPAGWPKSLPEIAGTLALASLAGMDVEPRLAVLCQSSELEASPWHAAQVIAALGPRAPPALFRVCINHLEREPWSPWTAFAAKALGEHQVLERVIGRLVELVRSQRPYLGGVGHEVPEIAPTAATVEALGLLSSSEAERATRHALGFIRRHQLRGDDCPAAVDPKMVHGAFPISPVQDFLRVDVTAHAVLALAANH
ncbi:MAG TPA: AMMECR1 domain-containing protein [Polyangiaceae bacterium]